MEQTRNEEDAMRKNMGQNTEEKKVQKSNFVFQKLTTENFWICLGKKKDTEMKNKLGKDEGRKEEWDQEREEKWVKTKRGYAKMAMEKKQIRIMRYRDRETLE